MAANLDSCEDSTLSLRAALPKLKTHTSRLSRKIATVLKIPIGNEVASVSPISWVKPSVFIAEKSLDLSSRLALASQKHGVCKIIQLIENSEGRLRESVVPADKPLFDAFPSEIILQSYDPFKVYEVIVQFRNNDKIARRLEIENINSPFFSVFGFKNHSLKSVKVAPGMDASFVIRFKPEEEIDYSCNLICVTEREKFVIPIRATGPRGK
ncbi:hypothetical protein HK096_000449 [Nowakowskiella sp. JEL0078]|nr:hypothetical protein HK096_000449 [Nowakowskiella sp. JEL0078]